MKRECHDELERGRLFRDLDGQLVSLVKVSGKLCYWVPVSQAEATRQVTHRDNFVRRFRPLSEPGDLKKAA
ncbi:MAG: hypothetical protein ACR2IF_05340 [Terriglobales bacterium]